MTGGAIPAIGDLGNDGRVVRAVGPEVEARLFLRLRATLAWQTIRWMLVNARLRLALVVLLVTAAAPRTVPAQVPSDIGQVWKTYDIAPFVRQAGTGSERHGERSARWRPSMRRRSRLRCAAWARAWMRRGAGCWRGWAFGCRAVPRLRCRRFVQPPGSCHLPCRPRANRRRRTVDGDGDWIARLRLVVS